jgi:branched-subunit amino acid aminotransferase/4-amino-4-deoxychorismate lyase
MIRFVRVVFMNSINPLPDPSVGIFTSIGIRSGRPTLLAQHLQRLIRGCRDVYGLTPPGTVEVEVLRVASALSDMDRIRIDVIPNGDELMVRIDAGPRPGSPAPIEVDVYAAPEWNGSQKWMDRSMLPSTPALLVDDGYVLELDIANVFAVIDDEVVTPLLEDRILPGIGRAHLMDICAVREVRLPIEQFLLADEVFATNAVRGVFPIVRCGHRIWDAGAMTARLAALWESTLFTGPN